MIDRAMIKARVRAKELVMQWRPVRKLRWHVSDPQRLPIIRKRFDGWEARDAEYRASGEIKETETHCSRCHVGKITDGIREFCPKCGDCCRLPTIEMEK